MWIKRIEWTSLNVYLYFYHVVTMDINEEKKKIATIDKVVPNEWSSWCCNCGNVIFCFYASMYRRYWFVLVNRFWSTNIFLTSLQYIWNWVLQNSLQGIFIFDCWFIRQLRPNPTSNCGWIMNFLIQYSTRSVCETLLRW